VSIHPPYHVLTNSNALPWLQSAPLVDSTTSNGFVSVHQIDDIVVGQGRNVIPFITLLGIARTEEVKEPLHRIFGLLGLTSKDLNLINVNYEWNIWEGYVQFGKVFVQKEASLLLFSMTSSSERRTEVPTWCPNFHFHPVETRHHATSQGPKAPRKQRVAAPDQIQN
jgi:hypothetical protein